MVNKKQTSSVLPHLPKGMGMPQITVSGSNDILMPGQKTLPASSEWKNGDAQSLVPGMQTTRKPSIAKQGVPWTDRQSKVQIDGNNEAPPMFAAAPRRTAALIHPRESKAQKHVYRMESGIDPVVLLTTRLESWRLAVKNLVALFKKVVAVETKTSKGLVNASKEIALPFRESNGQFLESGGIQDVWSAIRDYTLQHGIMHQESSSYLMGAVIPALRAIKADIKTMILQISKDKALKSDLIFDSRMQVDRLITRLGRVIESTQRAPQLADHNTDPFLINLGIIHAIRELCDHENRLHDNVLNLQKETGIFEQKIIESVRHVLKNYQDYRVRNKMEYEDFIGRVNETFDHIQPTTEWNNFVHRNQFNLVMENSGYKTENMVEYPNQDSRFVRATKIGPLQLKTGMMRGWTEGVYILTPAGFLHGYKTPKHFQQSPLRPNYSIFVPNTSIEVDEETYETFSIGLQRSRVNLGGNNYTFRAPTIEENQSWFEALVRMADQFRVVPLLEMADEGFSSAPVHRDLPPLPNTVLPNEGEPTRAIESGPSQQGGMHQQITPAGTTNELAPVGEDYEEEEDGASTPKQLTHSSQVLHSSTADDQSSIDNWQSTTGEEFGSPHSKTAGDLDTARAYLDSPGLGHTTNTHQGTAMDSPTMGTSTAHDIGLAGNGKQPAF